MLAVGLLLALLIAFFRLQFLLESPLYHIARGEYQEAQLAASELLEKQVIITPETDPQPPAEELNYLTYFYLNI